MNITKMLSIATLRTRTGSLGQKKNSQQARAATSSRLSHHGPASNRPLSTTPSSVLQRMAEALRCR